MRHIDPKEVKKALPATWPKAASDAYKTIESMSAKRRKSHINSNAKWQQLSKCLGDLLNGKCWYCESIIKRSATPIDHFRPKNNVKEAPKHGGYWWLAYEWKNYRFACTHCNTFGTAQKRGIAGGKNDCFPLWDEKHRATGPRPSRLVPDPIEAELPILLDPFNDADPGLLWFDEDGSISPHPKLCANKNGVKYKRADESIKIYGLYQDDLKERRGKHLEKIAETLGEADDLLLKYEDGNATAKQSLDKQIQELKNAMADKSEYSAAVRCMLMARRATSDSAELALA
jgi:uncharacterized protein (TIGR02646 family)